MPAIERETLLKIYSNMVRLRCLDDKLDEMIASGVGITQHSTRGQEATTIAACAALEPQDYVMPYHRGWGWAIGKGMDPKILLAELLGKKTGCCVGKGGVHVADWALRIMGRPGVQAAHIPIAAGVGLSIKFRKTKDVVLCFFGDGASNEGNVHEGMNLASVWKAPVVFICENNLYALFTPNIETTSVRDIADRAKGYGIPGVGVDGNDAIAVYEVAREAIRRARSGEGPTFIEAVTYRYEGHSTAEDMSWRSKSELESWQTTKDPIARLRNEMVRSGIMTDDDYVALRAAVTAAVEDAIQYAEASPLPDTSQAALLQDVTGIALHVRVNP